MRDIFLTTPSLLYGHRFAGRPDAGTAWKEAGDERAKAVPDHTLGHLYDGPDNLVRCKRM
jgi:hypothetical protein